MPSATTPEKTTLPAQLNVRAPDRVNWICVTEIIVCYEGTTAELLAAGLARAEELQGEKKGCNRRTGELRAVRLQDGRVRLQMDADMALTRTSGFKQFLGGLLADSRLSLVQGEVRQ